MALTAQSIYEFEDFRLDAGKRLLCRAGAGVPLTSKCFETLLALLESGGETVEKDALLSRVWPDSVVEEKNLTINISPLRKALGESPQEHRYLVTVPGRSYRFVAEVRELTEGETELVVPQANVPLMKDEDGVGAEERGIENEKAIHKLVPVPTRSRVHLIIASLVVLILIGGAAWWWKARHRATELAPTSLKSIAVLPFKSLDPTPEAQSNDKYLGVGLTDVLITRLSNIGDLAVRPTRSVLRFAEQDPLQAGRTLQVDSVLDVSIQTIRQQSGDRVRVTLHLLRVADGQSLWAYQCDEAFTDVFALEDRISQKVTELLSLKLTGDEQRRLIKRYTENVEAYRAYLKGRSLYLLYNSPADREQAVALFQEALNLDGNYALAYAGLAALYSSISGDFASPHEYKPKARSLAQQALKLDDHLAEAHAVLARELCFYDWDYAGAEQEFKRALALNPNLADANMWYGEYLALMGRFDEALVVMKRAAQLDPLAPIIAIQAGFPHYLMGHYDEAINYLQQGLALNPNSRAIHTNLCITYAVKGEGAKAITEFQQLIQTGDHSPTSQIFLAFAQARAGDHAVAQTTLMQVLSLPGGYVAPGPVATVSVALGEREQAFIWLERAYAERSDFMVWLKTDPRWDSLRADPRFADLLQRVGLAHEPPTK